MQLFYKTIQTFCGKTVLENSAGLRINGRDVVNAVTDMFRVYPLVTFGVFGFSPEYGDGTSTFVFGGGAGAEYFLTENVKLYLDAVYQYGKKDGVKMVNNPVLSLGIAYAF